LSKLIFGLNQRVFHNLYVDGGKTIQSFLKEGFIDEMIITAISIIFGDGIPLFGTLSMETSFKFEKTEYLNETMVKSYYRKR
jgi:dihydrofolate reductase